jgi:F-type H+-transporting ATPase subunit gamma
MSRRRNLQHHRHSLAEIRNIMNSMKNLAYMETRKLSRFLDAQQAMVQSIEEVATDFVSFYPETLPKLGSPMPVFLLMGSERGFCGDFNHALINELEQHDLSSKIALISIGSKLNTLLEGDLRLAAQIEGASVVEEVGTVLNRLADEIVSYQAGNGPLDIYCVYHDAGGTVVTQQILPAFQMLVNSPPRYAHPPLLNLAPTAFLAELTDQYLLAKLHSILYTSLMSENHHRVTHLEGAVNHLDEQSADLLQQCNALRQEEIIEEIEVILLNTANIETMPKSSGT